MLGPVDDHLELEATLKDYEEDWFIGIENKPGWNEAILQEKPNLFTIGYDADKVSSGQVILRIPLRISKSCLLKA